MFGLESPTGCSPAFDVAGSVLGVVNNATIGVDTVVPTPWGDEYRFAKPACDPTIPVEVMCGGKGNVLTRSLLLRRACVMKSSRLSGEKDEGLTAPPAAYQYHIISKNLVFLDFRRLRCGGFVS